MHTVAEAAARMVALVAPLASETVALDDALGRVLADDVRSPVTLPHWPNSAMDGYAVRADDVRGASAAAPRTLHVLGTVAAGTFADRPVHAGACWRIMTGAPVPEGADSVVRVEDTDGGVDVVTVRDDRDAGKNVRPAGEDVRAGDIALGRGSVLGPAQLGVLASVGAATVRVHRRPRVAIVGSGDELVGLDRFDEVLAGRRVVASNNITLRALVQMAGGLALDHGVAPDDPDALRARLEAALADAPDLLLTSAGISVGAHDHTRTVLAELGGTLDLWRVRMRPGAPVGCGRVGGVPWIGLPGNPVSALVTGELFARAAIRRLAGHARVHRRPEPVVLAEPVRTSGAVLTHFLRAVVTVEADGRRTARLTGPQGSGILTSMSRANALLVVPEGTTEAAAGTVLHALLLDDGGQLGEGFAL